MGLHGLCNQTIAFAANYFNNQIIDISHSGKYLAILYLDIVLAAFLSREKMQQTDISTDCEQFKQFLQQLWV